MKLTPLTLTVVLLSLSNNGFTALPDYDTALATNTPHFLWTTPKPLNKRSVVFKGKPSDALLARAAQSELKAQAAVYHLNPATQATLKFKRRHRLPNGAHIVQLHQQINGIEVFGQRLNVLLDNNLQAVAFSGQVGALPAALTSKAKPLPATEAIARAFYNLHQETLRVKPIRATTPQAYQLFTATGQNNPHRLRQPVRLKTVWYATGKQLELAYYLELNTSDAQQRHTDYAYVLSARNGAVLARHNMVQSESAPFNYRVWANSDTLLPNDSPYGDTLTPLLTKITKAPKPITPTLMRLSCAFYSPCDPWLPANARQTVGNNVMAYADLTEPDGFSNKDDTGEVHDVMGSVSAVASFDYSYNFSLTDNFKNDSQLQAAISNVFYTTNLMHDWLYGHGFDELAGNGQASNYGRGGYDSDRMLVEINDYSGTNNANMYTPPDGQTPVMQLYAWTHENRNLQLTFNGQNHRYSAVTSADFGAASFNLSGKKVVLIDDGSDMTNDGSTGSNSDGCDLDIQNRAELAGAVALIDRGSCNFYEKATNAQIAGAAAVLIANNRSSAMVRMAGSGFPEIDTAITIPVLGISQQLGKTIKSVLNQKKTVTAVLTRQALPPFNSALDNSIVIHEWCHFLSQRLVYINNNQGNSLGEGWSDFLALLALTKESDSRRTGNAQFQGAYAVGQYAATDDLMTHQYALGIRRYPYSTDMSKNPLTFKHIKQYVALPSKIAARPTTDLTGADNAEVHNSGEVLATMLWEAYVALLNDTARLSFTQAQNRMLDYLVASLKLTPSNPTFLEARDALLAVAKTTDSQDYALFWQAFAKRGAGLKAKAPRRLSSDHSGVVEDYTTP